MPIKDPIKRKAYEQSPARMDRARANANRYYELNKKDVLAKHAKISDVLKDKCKEWRKNNPGKRKSYKEQYEKENREQTLAIRRKSGRRNREKMPDYYVANQLKQRTGLAMETIKSNPQLIENHRMQIKVKRLIRTKKNENTKTS